jgi:hypothetical protein
MFTHRDRDTLLTVKVASSERTWFHEIAAAKGITLSELVRQSIAVEGARLGVPAPAVQSNPVQQ